MELKQNNVKSNSATSKGPMEESWDMSEYTGLSKV